VESLTRQAAMLAAPRLEEWTAKAVIPTIIDLLHPDMLRSLIRERRLTDELFLRENLCEFKSYHCKAARLVQMIARLQAVQQYCERSVLRSKDRNSRVRANNAGVKRYWENNNNSLNYHNNRSI
jgi:hypothetical protein